MYDRMAALNARWMSVWVDADQDAALDAFGRLIAHYTEPGRFYHNIEHIESVIRTFDVHSAMAVDDIAVQLALWYHDAIYDTRSKDNELRSADFAVSELKKLGLDPAKREKVFRLVMATRHSVALESSDEIFITDIDLRILSQDTHTYDAFAYAIRKEYDWVSADAYRDGRTKVLQSFIDRGVYTSPLFRDKFAKRAIENLTREIKAL